MSVKVTQREVFAYFRMQNVQDIRSFQCSVSVALNMGQITYEQFISSCLLLFMTSQKQLVWKIVKDALISIASHCDELIEEDIDDSTL